VCENENENENARTTRIDGKGNADVWEVSGVLAACANARWSAKEIYGASVNGTFAQEVNEIRGKMPWKVTSV
jgi:hypothetical protein